MSAVDPDFKMRSPGSLGEALDIYAQESEGWKLFAGGTDLMVEIHAGRCSHNRFLSLHRVRELRGIHVDENHVTLGATTTYADILASEVIAQEFPNLREAARWTGAIAIQNRGTIGGNIGNASPAADTPPVLIAYDAEIELASARGRRVMPYSQFHTGYKTTAALSGEIITRIKLPRTPPGRVHFYRKVGPRGALAISKVSIAGVAKMSEGIVRELRVAFASLAPTVLHVAWLESRVVGASLSRERIEGLCTEFRGALKPIDDIRSTAEYRATVAVNLLREFLETLA